VADYILGASCVALYLSSEQVTVQRAVPCCFEPKPVTQQRANTTLYHYSVGIVRAVGKAKYTHSVEEHNKNP